MISKTLEDQNERDISKRWATANQRSAETYIKEWREPEELATHVQGDRMTDRDEESEGFLDHYGSSISSSVRDDDNKKASNTSKRREAEEREDTTETEQETDGQTDNTGEASSGDSDEATQNNSEVPIKDRKSVLMYLPDDVWQELDIRFDELNAEYKRKYGEALEKNRDYYPAVIRAGLTDKDLEDVLDL